MFLFLLVFEALSESHSIESLIPRGVEQIIQEYYVKHQERFDILVAGKGFKSLVTSITKKVNAPYKLIQVDVKKMKKIKLSHSAVVLVDTLTTLDTLFNETNLKVLTRDAHFLVYIRSEEYQNRRKFELIYRPETSYQFCFLFEMPNKSLALLTWQMFFHPLCNLCRRTVEVNRMSVKKKVWNRSVFFPNRFDDFHGCVFPVTAYLNMPPLMHFKRSSRSLTHYDDGHGVLIRMHETIAKHLNFRFVYKVVKHDAETYDNVLLSNKIMKRFENGFSISPLALHFLYDDSESIILTHPIGTRVDLFVIPLGELYTPFEKMFLPFDFDVWVWMIVTFSTGIVTILVVKLLPEHVRHFVFGKNVKSPLMNMM